MPLSVCRVYYGTQKARRDSIHLLPVWRLLNTFKHRGARAIYIDSTYSILSRLLTHPNTPPTSPFTRCGTPEHLKCENTLRAGPTSDRTWQELSRPPGLMAAAISFLAANNSSSVEVTALGTDALVFVGLLIICLLGSHAVIKLASRCCPNQAWR